MKNLKDLKEEIINKQFQHFYVFYGEDYGLRDHYIKEIAKQFNNKITTLYSLESLIDVKTGNGLLAVPKLYVVHGDIDFARKKKLEIQKFIKRLKIETVIMCFEEELNTTTLFKEFSEYITYFPCVQDNIALQFIDSEISLSMESKEELAKDCKNNYFNILMETDKIKHYATVKNISHQDAYNELSIKEQLLYTPPEYHSDLMMDDILKGNYGNMGYWYQLIKTTFNEDFWITTESIMQDLLIAYFLVKDGRLNGGNKAYDLKFRWGRIKKLREFVIPYDAPTLLQMAYEVADIDAKVKNGKLEKEKVIDYIICLII